MVRFGLGALILGGSSLGVACGSDNVVAATAYIGPIAPQ
jgi:hypothetical protein